MPSGLTGPRLDRFTAYEDVFFSAPGDTQDHRLARLEREVAGFRSQVADLERPRRAVP